MNRYHLTLRRVSHAHAIPHVLVELSAKAPSYVTAAQVMESVQVRWQSWTVIGIERSA
jgi:hypothetical protein